VLAVEGSLLPDDAGTGVTDSAGALPARREGGQP